MRLRKYFEIGQSMKLKKALETIIRSQHGYFSSRQAAAAGYGQELQSYHTRCGNWKRIERGLFRLAGYADTDESEMIRWSLWACGQSNQRIAVVSHQSALYYYKLSELRPEAVHLSVTTVRANREILGCVLHWQQLEPTEYSVKQGFLITTPYRSLIDMKPDLVLGCLWQHTVGLAFSRHLIDENEAHNLTGKYPANQSAAPCPALAVLPGTARKDGALVEGVQADTTIKHGRVCYEGTDMSGLAQRGRIGRGITSEWIARGRSFTLVEMLVVIAIIAVLAGMLMPALMKAVEGGRKATCMNNLKQFGASLRLYADDNNNYKCPGVQLPNPPQYPTHLWWEEFLYPYMGVKVADHYNRKNWPYGCSSELALQDVQQRNFFTYLSNEVVIGYYASLLYLKNFAGTMISSPGKTAVFLDGDFGPTGSPTTSPYNSSSGYPNLRYRHLEQCNAVYLDGHAGSFSDPDFDAMGVNFHLPTSPNYKPEWAKFWGRE